MAVTGAGLTPVLEQEGPFTVFLPTTEAFAAIDNATVSSFIQNITLLQREYQSVIDLQHHSTIVLWSLHLVSLC